uniref:Uncharacterized protein n=1 Tax=Nitophyllum punctatum TaxID=158729 RepID=A0A4D6WVI0_9FLOR|nr:hypothetical protein [Nitophyllum punctatum]
MSISKHHCPVPFDQQPLNEYLALQKSWLFTWSTYETKLYLYNIFLISNILIISLGLFLYFLFVHAISLYTLLLIDLLFVNIFLLCIIIRIYLGWSYIVKRLLSSTVFYEESGWYDGQVWVKTAEILIQDRLIGLYQIMPFMSRIKYTVCWLIINLIILIYSFIYFYV